MDSEITGTGDTTPVEPTSTAGDGGAPAEPAAQAAPEPAKEPAKEPSKPKTAREAISAAFDKLKKDKEDEAAKDPTGKRAVKTAPEPAKEPAKEPAAAAPKDEIDPLTGQPYVPIKAPAAMPAVLREQFKNLPRNMQQYWAQRELDMAQKLTTLSTNTTFADAIRKAVAPIEGTFKQWNLTPEQGISRILEEAHLLVAGSPQQKGAYIAQLIKQYKPDANVLKAVLGGQQVNVQPLKRQLTVDELVDQRLKAREQEQLQKVNDTAITSFMQSNEFAGDLQEQMAAVITGKLVSTEGKSQADVLKAAYDFCVANSPEIQGILKARGQQPAAAAAATPATSTAAPVRAVRSAAPSLGGGTPSASPNKKYKTTREAALAAWDATRGNQ